MQAHPYRSVLHRHLGNPDGTQSPQGTGVDRRRLELGDRKRCRVLSRRYSQG